MCEVKDVKQEGICNLGFHRFSFLTDIFGDQRHWERSCVRSTVITLLMI